MAAVTLRIPDNLKKKLTKIAEREGVSLNQLLNEYLNVGHIFSHYIGQSTQVFVKGAKGYEPEQVVILPVEKKRLQACR